MSSRHTLACACGDHEISTDYYQQHRQYELTAVSLLPTLPQEVQDRVLESCDFLTLGILCRLDKQWNEKTTPLLWRHLDFIQAFEDNQSRIEASRNFFATCDTLIDQKPDRFEFLASNVRTLHLGRLLGIYIVHKEREPGRDEYAYFDSTQDASRNIFDVIAKFINLEALSLFVKSWWGGDLKLSGKSLQQGITNLKYLKIGGHVSKDILRGLLHAPNTLQNLLLINLVHGPGQDHGPDAIIFLSGLYGKFHSLRSLHLCKLADLEVRTFEDEDEDEDDSEQEREYVSGMRWEFPRESEAELLREWASLIRCTSSTLEDLTLENRFLCSYGFDDLGLKIDPGNTEPAEYGAHSVRETQHALFPVLSGEWPKLKHLTLIGLGTIKDMTQEVCHLASRVRIEHRPAGIEIMKGDVTPEQISTPIYFGAARG